MTKTGVKSRNDEAIDGFQVQPFNSEDAIVGRLRDAVRSAGGNAVISDRTGIPKRTLGRYLAGQDIKLPSLIAIARACAVSLEWLATGADPAAAPPAAAAAPAATPDLFAIVDMDLLGSAIAGATQVLEARGVKAEGRGFAQIVCLLYDEGRKRIAEMKSQPK